MSYVTNVLRVPLMSGGIAASIFLVMPGAALAEKSAEQIKCEEEGGTWSDKGNGNTFCFKKLPPMQKANGPSGGSPARPASAVIGSDLQGRAAASSTAKQDQSHDVHELEKVSLTRPAGTAPNSEEAPGYTISGVVKNQHGIAPGCAASPAASAATGQSGKAPERCASQAKPERP